MTGAAPVMHPVPSRKALSTARVALFLTLAAWCGYFVEQLRRYLEQPFSVRGTIESLVYLGLVTFLTGSASAYLLARLGYLQRVRLHRRVPRAVLDPVFDGTAPSLTAIIPCYREDERVIRQTMLSAALQEYPDLRVILLIDDPPNPDNPAHRALLEDARAVPGEIAALLAEPLRLAREALDGFEDRTAAGDFVCDALELERLAGAYEAADEWLRGRLEAEPLADHVDAFLINEIYLRLAADFAAVARALREAAGQEAELSPERLRHLYRRLVWVFSAELGSFERKGYASLSDEPNKAMNLNSFIGLMGGRYRERVTRNGTVLLPVSSGEFDLEVPEPDYVLTLDADSMLLPEYCLRLVAYMEDPAHAEVAIVQTPYSAFRGAPTRIERIAGATTDLQHIVHQGLSRYGAAFWVGANAVIRKRALDDVLVEEPHGGFTIHRYISDRTVIEDTESTLDLRLAGWQLVNYPERLSYSATPPDFGALCIQRQRWANGGLLVLPRLWRLVRTRSKGHRRAMAIEAFLRVNYLASIAWASLGLWLLLFYPFDQTLLSRFAVFTAVPYFVAQATDLHRCGYRRTDVLRLYGFNLMLLSVNAVGAIKSIGQAIGGQKVAFARTPKVRNRTVAPFAFVALPFAIAIWSAATFAHDLTEGNYLHAAFAGTNALLTIWVMLSLHGIRNSASDMVHDLRERLYVPVRGAAPEQGEEDWVSVLYHGTGTSGEQRESAAVAEVLAAMDRDRDAEGQLEVELKGSSVRTRPEPDRSRRAEQLPGTTAEGAA